VVNHFFSNDAPAGIDFSEGEAGTAVGRGTRSRLKRASRGRPSPRMETKPIMKRVFVVTLLSFAATGCAQSRSALSKQDSPALAPVAATSVPPLSDTINLGMGNPAVVRMAIKDPDNSQWAGVAPATAAKAPSAESRPAPGQPPPKFATTPGGPAAFGPFEARANSGPVPSGQPVQPADAMTTPATRIAATPVSTGTPLAASLADRPEADSQPLASTVPDPGPATALGGSPGQPSLIEPAETIAGPPTTGLIPVPPDQAAPGSNPGARGPETTERAPASTSALAQPAPLPASPRQARRPVSDPLLGPDPDLMPPIPDVSELNSKTAPQSASPASKAPSSALAKQDGAQPAVKPQASSPSQAPAIVKPNGLPDLPDLPDPVAPAVGSPPPQATAPAAAPAAAPAVIPLELAPAPASTPAAPSGSDPERKGAGDSAALAVPAHAGAVGGLPPLEPAPKQPRGVMLAAAQQPPQRPQPPLRDQALMRTSGEKPENPKKDPAAKSKPSSADRRRLATDRGCPIAKVGDDVITLYDWTVATREQLRRYPELKEAYKDPTSRDEARKHISLLGKNTLDALIDRSLLVQDAKRHISNKKDTKMIDRFNEEADRIFRESEILPLQKKYRLDNEYQVKEKLAEEGRSITQMQQNFRQMFIAENYLHSRLGAKVKVELPELLKYYSDHVDKHEFDRPALITWREIIVEPIEPKPAPAQSHDSTVLLTSEDTSRDAAGREAEALLAKLRRGADFATLARKDSDGPAASRNQGGLMETSPGGYGVGAVNKALETLPIGQLSGLIEGPDGFHIVKVEKRRPAGPASFEEVYNQIKPKLENEKYASERTAFIAKLRKHTLITTYDLNPRKKPATTVQN